MPAPKIAFVSLGCPKALVDSERLISRLRAEGYELAREQSGAAATIVNTCGFLDSAKAESLAAIGQAAEHGAVIVTGCLGAEPETIREKFPGLRFVSGPQDFESVMRAVHEILPPPHDPFSGLLPPQGVKLTPRHYAYLKISEGCNNRCTFCIIPKLRGSLVSRPPSEILREAEKLAAAGVKELLVISQDTGAYGLDIKDRESQEAGRQSNARLTGLARELGKLGLWIRLHYLYPYPHVDGLIELMAEGAVLPYLDIPFQHASPNVLRAMRRPGDSEKLLGRIEKWRAACPGLTLRSTFIVGFPGETEEDFALLLDWLDAAKIDRAGAFRYEPVKGAAANGLGLPPVADEVKEARYRRFMEKCQAISARKLKAKIGMRLPVIVDQGGVRGGLGRTKGDAPEIDGKVHISARRPLRQGDIVTVKIERSDAYDLYGTAA
ncbi:MAG TPA: 30S ribosomal protein S12 methylthiotransferase RimO [Methylocella sp.]|nr:30S ribosomal protein S12 methylthiotransferase RimO [Methylocella sp.]